MKSYNYIENHDDDIPDFRDPDGIEATELSHPLGSLNLLMDDTFLRTQAFNLSLVDHFIMRLELTLHRARFNEEKGQWGATRCSCPRRLRCGSLPSMNCGAPQNGIVRFEWIAAAKARGVYKAASPQLTRLRCGGWPRPEWAALKWRASVYRLLQAAGDQA